MSSSTNSVPALPRFIHLRYVDERGNYDNHFAVTVAYQYEATEPPSLQVAIARCRWPDNFCRRTGRLICLGRLRSGDYYRVTAPDDLKKYHDTVVNFVQQKVAQLGGWDEEQDAAQEAQA